MLWRHCEELMLIFVQGRSLPLTRNKLLLDSCPFYLENSCFPEHFEGICLQTPLALPLLGASPFYLLYTLGRGGQYVRFFLF